MTIELNVPSFVDDTSFVTPDTIEQIPSTHILTSVFGCIQV